MLAKVAIIHNLPGGGAMRMLIQIVNSYKNNLDIDIYSIGEKGVKNIQGVKNINYTIKPWKGFLLYNLWIIFVLPIIHKNIAKHVDWSKYKFVLFTHDYFTKSPYLLRYISNNKKYYLCQESQREFYEPVRFHAETIIEKIAILFRYPIKIIDQKNVKYASICFCNSKYSKKNLEKIYKRKFEIVYPGVDVKYFTPGKEIKKNLIVCVGGINKTKNQQFLINSMREILNTYQLLLIGDGKEKIIEKIKSQNKNIKIKKQLPDYELRRIYRQAKITCVVAYREPFGLTSIESQSCGTPVITVNDGGTKETLINKKSGYISQINEEEFHNYLIKTLANYHKMGHAARKNVERHWTMEKTLKPLDKYFLQ